MLHSSDILDSSNVDDELKLSGRNTYLDLLNGNKLPDEKYLSRGYIEEENHVHVLANILIVLMYVFVVIFSYYVFKYLISLF
jgi:hypothetical protein